MPADKTWCTLRDMKLPAFNHHGVLPPFIGTPTQAGNVSPYRCSLVEVIEQFGTSKERLGIIEGLLRYRSALREAGCTIAWQWLDGSFVEDAESDDNKGRPPGDIDIVTFTDDGPPVLPTKLIGKRAKREFSVDAYLVSFSEGVHTAVQASCFWLQLFSHSREGVWKGMLMVECKSDDEAWLALAKAREDLADV